MAQDKVASLRSQLFAVKGTATPASGFRVVQGGAADAATRARPADADRAGPPMTEDEPPPAASLQGSGFKFHDIDHEPDTPALALPFRPAPDRNPDPAGPVQPEAAAAAPTVAAAAAGSAATETPEREAPAADAAPASEVGRHMLLGAGLVLLLLAALGLGYGLSTLLRGGPAPTAPVAATDRPPAEPATGVAAPAQPDGSGAAAAPDAAATAQDAPAGTAAATPSDPNAGGPTEADAPSGSDAGPTPAQPTASTAGRPDAGGAAAPPVSESASEPAPELADAPRPAGKPDAPAAGVGGYLVQVGSLPTRAGAERLWQELTREHSGVFAGLQLDVQQAQLDGRIVFRARTGAFDGYDAAATFCGTLRARGLDCLVVRR